MSGRSPAILGSIAAWWLVVVLPGVLTLAGAFGEIDANTTIPGRLIAIWLACFIGQLVLVYVIGYAAGHVRGWWFFVASILPWAVDWASPVSHVMAAVFVAVAAGFAALMAALTLTAVHLDEHGVQVDATVVKVLPNYMNIVVNNAYIRRRVRVSFTMPDGQARQHTLGMLCEIGTGPSAGEHLSLRVDPHHPWHVAVDPSELGR